MDAIRRIGIMAEMHGRDLMRRHAALGLLVALPLCFYLASMGSGSRAVVAGGVGMAFSVSGATLFSLLSSEEVDQRLVLGGYRPLDLLLGRLGFLAPLGLAIAGLFSVLMLTVSHPYRPWLAWLGVSAVAVQAIPFGLAVGAVVPKELEGTLVLIGVVGMQLAVEPDNAVAKALPFYGPQQVIESSLTSAGGPILWPLLLTLGYGLVLMLIARAFLGHRLEVVHHEREPG
ncbi:hypothetical protein [Dermatobacter hominis]|uniref:hypothetical protein n=1 Tax=Dermatobacter hominis TaxID=2884263 RepID=UPI001D11DE42|nr:hypothetical protein [Dermatobacter hominis]UDY34523.1 hypothetical protein LH044_14400 [Dermatobacter hominis]